ncbi:MAG: amidohydrolase [Spirochaetaceae bacterium]|jgi:predicted amidohydrolase YtcJ|nr:amidohydrolase [Spirochaetaceae bacterium]
MKKILYNAKVYLRRETFAQALLIEDQRIAALGSNEDILAAAGRDAERIDARGKLLLPGFHDCHLHLNALGRQAQMIDLSGLDSIEALIERGREALARLDLPAGAVALGRGFDQEAFAGEKRFPTRGDLDRITTERPLMITRICGHVVVCNTRMLERAGIAESAPEVAGGKAETGEDGRPNGVLRENAAALVRRLLPAPSEGELQRNLSSAMREALAHGLTAAASFDIGGPDFQQVVDAYSRIYRGGGPPLRITLQCGISGDPAYLDEYIGRGLFPGTVLHEPYLKMGPFKLFADGTLGSRTAWMREPYRDSPGATGFPVMDPALMGELLQKAAAHGLQTMVHAIGDAAMESVISCYEAITGPGHNPLRHGILHCQITDRGLLERMAKNDILALVQPVFLLHDHYMVESRVGRALASTSYAWGSMERLGIRAAYGTDCPVESLDPIQGIACAVTRKDPAADHPREGFFPEERVDVYTAVDNYTAGSAYANFDEGRMGRIRPGALADLVLLDRDIFTIPPEEIHKAGALCTLVGGEFAHGRDAVL